MARKDSRKMKEKILITGVSGYIGNSLADTLSRNYKILGVYNDNLPENLDNIDLIKMDLTKNNFEKLESFKPEVIIHCAAKSGLYGCEKNKEESWKINVKSSIKIAKLAKKCGSFLIVFSSDQIFNGKQGNYSEIDQIDPVNYYGYTKSCAEKEIKIIYSNVSICRTALVYGGNNKKLKGFWNFLLSNIKNNRPIDLYSNLYTTPTHIQDLIKMVEFIISKKKFGTFHLVGKEKVSRYEFGILVGDFLKANSQLFIPEKLQDDKLKRPLDTSLIQSKIFNSLKISSNIKESLIKYQNEN